MGRRVSSRICWHVASVGVYENPWPRRPSSSKHLPILHYGPFTLAHAQVPWLRLICQSDAHLNRAAASAFLRTGSTTFRGFRREEKSAQTVQRRC
ncbi:hypothetical protein BDZ89DRAFT_1058593 [Hymenopellis radicata]|nr:hypothetical protein BDZ89DRAFT_1058593 [Hymenopellis radicata]